MGRSSRAAPRPAQTGPRERILDAAVRLFYDQGYGATGIDQLTEEAGAYRKSLYRYFPSKESLATAYLESQEAYYLGALRTLMAKHLDLERFVAAWTALLLKQARRDDYRGCPFANFANQTHLQREQFRPELAAIMTRWRNELSAYLERAKLSGRSLRPGNADALAVRLIALHEGLAQLYVATGELDYLRRMGPELLDLARSAAHAKKLS